LNNSEKNFCQGRVAGADDRELITAGKSGVGRAQTAGQISFDGSGW